MSDKNLRFLYDNPFGRILLQALVQPGISRFVGRIMDSEISRCVIPSFIRRNGIDMGDYEEEAYPTFNAFFTRPLKAGRRPIDPDPNVLISPCDGRLSVYSIDEGCTMAIKGHGYTVTELTRRANAAESFRGGYAMVFRLCVDDYHRYCFVDEGEREEGTFIPGVLHTVQPIGLKRSRVFAENSREVTLLKTRNFENILQIEVGAMMVGRIKNHPIMAFRRGQEKGMFEFGGSTIVLLFGADTVILRQDLSPLIGSDREIRVRMGEGIGRRKI